MSQGQHFGGLEARLIGTVEKGRLAEELEQLLLDVSGLPAESVSLHELVLRPSMADRADLTLQHTLASSSGRQGDDRWWACQYGLPLRGRSNVSLPATVRSLVRSECSGEDVPGFWRALGFTPRYEMLKQGRSYEVHHGVHCIEITICQLHKVPPAGSLEQAEELVPGQLLVEASINASEGTHMDAAAALAAFAKLLQPLTSLQPLTTPPHGWLKQQQEARAKAPQV